MTEEIVNNVKRTWHVPYRWCYGLKWTQFFESLEKEKVIYGSRCSSCKKVLVPPAMVCSRCFVPTEEELVPVKDEGIIDAFTIVNLPYPGQPTTPPYAYGLIRLDGAHNLFQHLIDGIPLEDIKVGMRVQAVWSEERTGGFRDIQYFQPK